jgi:hypothetical protein
MITLGLSNGRVERIREPPPFDLPPLVRRALAETMAWCSLPTPQSDGLRSAALDPSDILDIGPFPNSRDGIKSWSQSKYQSYRHAVSKLSEQRSELLRKMNSSFSEDGNSSGKLLLYLPMETVTDGVAEAVSQSFFDGKDAPPWDTWFWYSEGAILSWVPEWLVSRAQAGIDAIIVDCIHWVEPGELSRLMAE